MKKRTTRGRKPGNKTSKATWRFQTAKCRFSELFRQRGRKGPNS